MHRQNIIEQLERYGRTHREENETVERFLSFVRQYEDCCERSLSVGHVTGSAWVVNKAESHVLLTHHKKLNRWLQLGGHSDGDTNTLRVAYREVKEESGLSDLAHLGDGIFDIDIHPIPARKSEEAHFHYDIRFAFQVSGSEEFVISDESHDLKWVEIEKIQDYTKEESMMRMASKWKRRTQ
ncbi:NUDIX hydrolase [Puniceicoccales bacterium CK1056]|uniref:NUDIX hydrolase n=1 Tax=Oceanipulchritudo coccoides TaxID=2706888 RepID=A0A6B2M0U2_9BACT|nr:NUDIX hydrolase [Oceanipulchritudo coccoides]NDV61939.1 NUDIX hydrolase [Oceanipulchritudo coccoides]